MSGVRIERITSADEGKRVDRWLKKQLGEVPQSLIFKLIRSGQLRVNGKRVKGDVRLQEGDEVRIPPVQNTEHKNKGPRKLSDKDVQFIQSLVIYDDGDVVVLNKPGDIATQGGTNTKYHIDGLLDGLKNKEGIAPRLVHRLDKETSGILILARSASSVRKLGEMFKTKAVEKRYMALVSPLPETWDGTINAPLNKAGGKNKERMEIDEKNGQFAITDYKVVDHAAKQMALVVFRPLTGRTHQIRAHASYALQTPIVGDYKYGYDSEGLETQVKAKRLHLHAYEIRFDHPQHKKLMKFTAPLPADIKKTWKSFGFIEKIADDVFES